MSMKSFLALAITLAGMMFSVSNVSAAENAVGAAAVAASDVVGKGGFSEIPTFGQVIEFQFTGLLVVFTVLGGLTLMCYLLAWLLKTVAPDQYHCRPKAKPVSAPPPKAASASVAPVAATAVPATPQAQASIHPGLADEELLAILAVAATEVLGQAVSVVRFRAMDSMDWTWSVQGRVGLHTSHTP